MRVKRALRGLVPALLAIFLGTNAASAQTLEFDMASNMNRNSYLGKVALGFANDVATATGGTVKLKFHEDGELVPVPEILNAVATGAVPAAFTWTGFFGGTVSVGKYFAGTPFGPGTDVWASWIWSGGGLAILQKGMDKINIKVLPCNPMPREGGGYFNKEIKTIADFQGLKMRISGWGGDVLRRVGVSVTAVPGSELYLSMERGRIDAMEYSSPLVDESLGFYKLAKFYYFPGWHQSTTWNSFIMNKAAWNKLSQQQQQQVELACRTTMQRSLTDIVPLQMEALRRIEANSAIKVMRFPDPLIKELYGIWQTVLKAEMAKDPLIREAHESLLAHAAKMRAWEDFQALPQGVD